MNRIGFSAVAEAKDLVIEIKEGKNSLHSMSAGNPIADLRIDLRMRIEIGVAQRPV